MKTKIILLLLTVTLSACGAKKKSIDREKVKKVERVETEKTKITTSNEQFEIKIESVIFEMGNRKSSALQKNSVFFTNNAKIRYDKD